MDTQVVEIDDCFCSRETEKAILVMLPDNDEKWIPKSQVHDDSEVFEDGNHGVLIISKWFADKEDLTALGDIKYIGA